MIIRVGQSITLFFSLFIIRHFRCQIEHLNNPSVCYTKWWQITQDYWVLYIGALAALWHEDF